MKNLKQLLEALAASTFLGVFALLAWWFLMLLAGD
jgi:hypothetical protein